MSASEMWARLARRIAEETGKEAPASLDDGAWKEPEWREASPGVWYQLLSIDAARDRVTMLVRLEPGVEYSSHVHADVEEVYMLEGEIGLDDRKLHPGDYSRAEGGTRDEHVWSEAGCTCLLVTSPHDVLE